MNYSPPTLNENITSAAKKTDATLYGIQIALAQATRPLDNFVYRNPRKRDEANSSQYCNKYFSEPDGECIPGHEHSGKATTAGGNNDKTIIRPITIGQGDRYNKASQEDQTSQALSRAPAVRSIPKSSQYHRNGADSTIWPKF
ncbi:hypothetical protein AYI69_g9262 [Smittium culicis]|uniref:Uncharacterized protein n=1 Tax=Smittium culicis TaxID=133412 RepID=A0A1R1XDW4_9FUNG|nr:hypothetical protein AYI69_g9262 [Smittium culicis]